MIFNFKKIEFDYKCIGKRTGNGKRKRFRYFCKLHL